jgi:hypothetical protein
MARMNFLLRPTTIDDLSMISQLLQQAFHVGPNAPFLDPSVMAWKYWDRRGDWEGPRSYVLEHDGVIVAHSGIMPVTFSAGKVRGIHMIDWASARECPGSGIALLQELDGMFDFIYSIGGSKIARKLLPSYGYVEYARQWKGARPLRPLQQILKHQYRNWKLAPRLVRNLLWALPKAQDNYLLEGWKSEEIGPGEVSEEFYSQNMADACFSPRPPDFFEYLLRCPVMRIRLYSIQDKCGPKGHFAIGVLRGQARVAGVWLREPDGDAWQAAFSLAQEAAMRLDCAYEIVAAGTEGPSQEGATRSGLRILGDTPVYLLNKKGRLTLPPNFQFQLSDDDGLFLDSGDSSFLS